MGPLVAFLASSRLRVDRKVESDLAKRSFRTPFLLIRMFLFFCATENATYPAHHISLSAEIYSQHTAIGRAKQHTKKNDLKFIDKSI